MSDRLPSLTALRAFDAAARHLSFQNAAFELNVTPAALSFQIKSLETDLGAPLFRRLNRAVELTEAGRTLAPYAKEAFETLQGGWRATKRLEDHGALTVTAGPAFTARWLAPRMFLFARDNPEVELRFAATLRLLDFGRDQIDVAIRFGERPPGGDPGLYEAMTIREWMTPMMHPDLVADYPTPESLTQASLITQEDTDRFRGMSWAAWFTAAGVEPPEAHGPRFSQADHGMDAAQGGGGVILGRITLADAALGQGALIAPFDLAIVPPAQYRVLCPEGSQDRPATRAFLDWLGQELTKAGDHTAGRRMVPTQ